MAINMITEDIPGSAEMNPSIVLRNRGAKDKARKTLNILKARKTEKPSDKGASEIAITKKRGKQLRSKSCSLSLPCRPRASSC